MLVGSVVLADQNQQNQQGDGNATAAHFRGQVKAQTTTELREMIQQRQQEMNQEISNLREKVQNMYQNQNKVRLAVHSFLAMEDMIGGIGRNVSQIAREFNNSVMATIRAEEKIQDRNWFARVFAGGDDQAAGELEREVNTNRERIQQLKQLREQCNCTEEIRTMMQEQIQNMEQEQNRLQQLAQTEKQSKGIFGWLWK
jgi:DNA-binding transcriptional MerR regulator